MDQTEDITLSSAKPLACKKKQKEKTDGWRNVIDVVIVAFTNEIIGFSHVIVPDWQIEGFLSQLPMLYIIAEFLERSETFIYSLQHSEKENKVWDM